MIQGIINHKRMIELLTPTSGLSSEQIQEKLLQIRNLIKELGIPHFFVTLYADIDKDGVAQGTNMSAEVKGQVESILELFMTLCIKDNNYRILFKELENMLDSAEKAGLISVLRDGIEKDNNANIVL